MLLTTFPVLELKLTLADDTEVVFRRVPYLHDVFVSEAGHLLRVQQPAQHDHNGRKAFRYGTSTLMTANLVADTYMPGWDAGEGANGSNIRFRDRNPSNCAVDNIVIDEGGPRRGRPASHLWKRLFLGLMVLEATLNLQDAVDAAEASEEQVLEACKALRPELYEVITNRTARPPKQPGAPRAPVQFLDRIGETPEQAKITNDSNYRAMQARRGRSPKGFKPPSTEIRC